jgi:hypothetical protein
VSLPAGSRLPVVAAIDPSGRVRSLAVLWADGPAVIVWGHSDCQATRLTLPYVDRLHEGRPAGSRVAAVLQDEEGAARALRSELALALPLWREPAPYAAASALRLAVVPTLLLVGRDGLLEHRSEGFRRTDMEALAERLGLVPPFFAADDPAPALRPG